MGSPIGRILAKVCIFVHEFYNPESRFATKIATHGKVALPCLMQMYGSDVGLVRAEAEPVIAQALAKTAGLDEKTIRAAKALILRALHDPEEADRINTIEALKSFGGVDMIPAIGWSPKQTQLQRLMVTPYENGPQRRLRQSRRGQAANG
jgi:hypothetical protein